VIDVSDRPNIQVRLISLEFFLRHCFPILLNAGSK
jgi:hypothetical protein